MNQTAEMPEVETLPEEQPANDAHPRNPEWEDVSRILPRPALPSETTKRLSVEQRKIDEAKQRQREIEQAARAQMERQESLRKHLVESQGRLTRLRAVDCDGGLQRAQDTVDQLFLTDCTPQAAEGLRLAMTDLAVWPALKAHLPSLITKQEGIVREIEKQLSDLQSEK